MMADKNSGFVQTKVAAISQKTMDINQFLVSKIGIKKVDIDDRIEPVDITYHDPCHLKKIFGRVCRTPGSHQCPSRLSAKRNA